MTKVGKNLQGQAASAAPGRRRRDADCAGAREGHGWTAGGPQSFVTQMKVTRRKCGLGNSRASERASQQRAERDEDFSGLSFIVIKQKPSSQRFGLNSVKP